MGLVVDRIRAGLPQNNPPMKCVQSGHHVLKTNHLAILTHSCMATLLLMYKISISSCSFT